MWESSNWQCKLRKWPQSSSTKIGPLDHLVHTNHQTPIYNNPILPINSNSQIPPLTYTQGTIVTNERPNQNLHWDVSQVLQFTWYIYPLWWQTVSGPGRFASDGRKHGTSGRRNWSFQPGMLVFSPARKVHRSTVKLTPTDTHPPSKDPPPPALTRGTKTGWSKKEWELKRRCTLFQMATRQCFDSWLTRPPLYCQCKLQPQMW